MLTRYDELLCHQITSTFDHPGTSAREWTERIWFMAHDTAGRCILVAGFGFYPNRNIIDSFACLAVDGATQHVVRASRELRPRIDEIEVGPFRWDVVEPMRKVRAVLGDNDYGVAFDVLFDATMPPLEEEPPQYYRSRGRVIEDVRRYFQVGKPSGRIRVDGRTIDVLPDSWRCERDHSWGVRRGAVEYMETGVQPGDVPPGYFYHGTCWQFENWGSSYHLREGWDGTVHGFSGGVFHPFGSGKDGIELARIEHDFTFRTDVAGLRQINGGRVVLHGVDGTKREVSIRPLGAVYIGTGGYSYANYRGFTHGLWMGPEWIDGFKLDLTDHDVLREITYLDELVCELRSGDEVGYGMTELAVFGKYPKYGFEGY